MQIQNQIIMMTENEILNNKIEFEKYNFQGVYFLINKNKIIYIGSSISVGTRLYMHRKNKRIKFDSWYYIKFPCLVDLRFYEAKYIYELRPRYNIEFNPDYENIRMILFAKFRYEYLSISNLSNEIGLSITTLTNIFDLKKEVKDYHVKRLIEFLYPNGLTKIIINKHKVKEVKREDFEKYKNRKYKQFVK